MKLTNRIGASNRRMASLKRSDELNQRIEPQNDPQAINWKFLKPLWGALGPSLYGLAVVSGCSWEVLGPLGRALGGGLGPLLEALGTSWDGLGGHLGTNQAQDRNPDRPGSMSPNIWG